MAHEYRCKGCGAIEVNYSRTNIEKKEYCDYCKQKRKNESAKKIRDLRKMKGIA